MGAALLGLLGLVVGAALSPLVTKLAAWPDSESPAEPGAAPAPSSGEAGFARPAALALGPSWQTTALALVTGAVFAVAALRYDEPGPLALALAYALALVVCAATDLRSFRVPNAVTYPAIALALAVATYAPGGDAGPALVGCLAGGGLFLVLAVVSRGGVGLGDVKLAALVGLALGWPLVFTALFLTAIAGGVAAGLLLLLRLRGRGDALPYAPFIAAAAVVVLLWQGTAFHQL